MKLNYFILLLSTAVISSCTWSAKKPDVKAKIAKDTLVYQQKTYKQRAPDCGNKADSNCTSIVLKYPEFKSQPALNDTVRLKLALLLQIGEKRDTSLRSLTDNFMKAYADDKKTTNRPSMYYTAEGEVAILRQDSSLTTLQYDTYTYTGGAHGASFTGFINWNNKNNKNLTLDDILLSGYQQQLNKIAEKIFRKQENLSDTSSLARDYFFKDARFTVNNNFLITPVGLRFVYNQYEIKPFAAGQTDLLVPYNQIKKLLKPNTVIAQYIKL